MRVLPAAVLLCAVACRAPDRERLTATVSDDWARSYPFSDGTELQLTNRYGSIAIEAIDGASAIDVRVHRIARAATDAAARTLVTRIAVEESVSAQKVVVTTKGVEGVLIGASIETNYQVSVPATARVRAQSVNGRVTAKGLSHQFAALTASGNITGRSLAGAVDARTNTGTIVLEMKSVGSQPITVRGGRGGSIELILPPDTRANLSATSTTGKISVTGVPFEPIGEQETSPRSTRVRGRIGGGGVPIELSTAIGNISVHAPSTLAQSGGR